MEAQRRNQVPGDLENCWSLVRGKSGSVFIGDEMEPGFGTQPGSGGGCVCPGGGPRLLVAAKRRSGGFKSHSASARVEKSRFARACCARRLPGRPTRSPAPLAGRPGKPPRRPRRAAGYPSAPPAAAPAAPAQPPAARPESQFSDRPQGWGQRPRGPGRFARSAGAAAPPAGDLAQASQARRRRPRAAAPLRGRTHQSSLCAFRKSNPSGLVPPSPAQVVRLRQVEGQCSRPSSPRGFGARGPGSPHLRAVVTRAF
ncbi:PREDICTED: transcription initiation factor TFIID subunit 4-like [Cercocebus atys]|uniref:transcription initiation factor TFIID subunit 4-like n=1 Tax=Cercocebus atys TaxID=9531 RepID=UPI0005F3F32E|nr:PREDICTED: transcription initiation factor TFIID subunit 4-like [Cercocebus atys]